MEINNDKLAWVNFVLFFGLPWLEFLVAIVFVQNDTHGEWSRRFAELKFRWQHPPTAAFRTLGIGSCTLMGFAGFFVIQNADATTSPMNVALAFHLAQLACVAVWIILLFEKHYLWMATIAGIAGFSFTMTAMVASAIVTRIALFFYLPYFALVAFTAVTTGFLAYDNQQPRVVSVALGNNNGQQTSATPDDFGLVN